MRGKGRLVAGECWIKYDDVTTEIIIKRNAMRMVGSEVMCVPATSADAGKPLFSKMLANPRHLQHLRACRNSDKQII